MKKLLIVITKAPYGSEDPFGAILFAGTGPTAEVQTKVVFAREGVHSAVTGQNPGEYIKIDEKRLELPNIEQNIRNISQVGVEFYALQKDLNAKGVHEEELINGVRPIDAEGFASLVLEADTSLVF